MDEQNENEEKNFVKPFSKKSTEKGKKIKPIPNKKSKYLTVINEHTGEIEAYIRLPEKNLGKDWVAVYQEAIQQIAIAHLPDEQNRVFMYMIGTIDFDNYWRISQKTISEALNMKQQNVSKAIRELCKRKVIVEGPRAGLNKTYRLNPHIAHKGKNRNQTIVDFESMKK